MMAGRSKAAGGANHNNAGIGDAHWMAEWQSMDSEFDSRARVDQVGVSGALSASHRSASGGTHEIADL
jgi:hypothetical protein